MIYVDTYGSGTRMWLVKVKAFKLKVTLLDAQTDLCSTLLFKNDFTKYHNVS